jgi:hypothetical protein
MCFQGAMRVFCSTVSGKCGILVVRVALGVSGFDPIPNNFSNNAAFPGVDNAGEA